ncbi:flagellar assembly protein FliH [Dyella jejuensis]|uniref:Flagellar assembly protein FliH n=1 Tax=Dyella jejuensis TaxID=1432009 RepID=A0ABW8JHE8_9GAMM
MTSYRRHAFPSLTRVLAGEDAPVEVAVAELALRDDMLEEHRQAGYDEGRAAGYAEGVRSGSESAARDAQAALEALSEPLDALVAGFAQWQRDDRVAAREQIAALVEQVARQVVRLELETHPEQLLAFVDEALADLPRPVETIEVRLHPDEYQRVLKAAPRRAKRYGLAPDPKLAPGECRISAGQRELDVGCAQRLAICMEQIHGVLHTDPVQEDA